MFARDGQRMKTCSLVANSVSRVIGFYGMWDIVSGLIQICLFYIKPIHNFKKEKTILWINHCCVRTDIYIYMDSNCRPYVQLTYIKEYVDFYTFKKMGKKSKS